MIQYQKRFEEIYEQINLINEKNRELINEINSKEEVKLLLIQKFETFNNLKSVYKDLTTKREKEDFKLSITTVLSSVDEMLNKTKQRLVKLTNDLEFSKEEFIKLQDYEQKYMKLIKEYNREYNRLYSNMK